METTFNPDATIIINKSNNFEAEYITLSTLDVQTIYHDKNRHFDRLNALQSKINKIIDNLTEEYFFHDSTDKDTVLEEICEILDINPTKTVQFSGSVHFTGSIDIPLNEVDSFDLTSALEDIYVDIHNGDVEIDNYELYEVEAD